MIYVAITVLVLAVLYSLIRSRMSSGSSSTPGLVPPSDDGLRIGRNPFGRRITGGF